ncbi:ATP-binding protein [Nocardioides sp. cx-173]|uniref:ATP-binding protein n=1 Tax=Nocardioides sp. cx-173 TaxID=2898796 RepID=UPI001E4464C6|nr:ATP-binding protein [Nocardioides sp. cx-173]MCD4524438.1 PAS domain-containing sensor histidine kinase [Nocardioides sp. cx-173]UGB43076.1 PAS domain-containing sensor histidine kinase [Nocardioides sp. cx-173]
MSEAHDERAAPVVAPGPDLRLFGAALDGIPDAVVVVDGSGCIRFANTQVREVFGYEQDELEGRQIEMLIPPRVREGHPHQRSGYPRRPMGLLKLAAVRKDGDEFPAEISLSPIETEHADRLTVATVRDISERLRLEDDAERARHDLLANVTHELRTPLTSILGYVEVMQGLDDAELGPEARRMLDVVQRNAERELQLVTDLLDVAVGSLGQTRLILAPVDVVSLLHEARAAHTQTARAAGLELVVSAAGPDPDAPPALTAHGDRHRLLQVLDNLVGNAVKFSPAGGVITLSAEGLADSVIVSVADTGAGIPLEDQGRVFERLHRGSNALTAQSPGAGLGLSIVQSIVTAHRGTVSIASDPGAGTLVTVQLPRSPEA